MASRQFKDMLYDYLINELYVNAEKADLIMEYDDYQVWDSWADFGKQTFWEDAVGMDTNIMWMENSINRCMDWDRFGKEVASDEVCEIGGKVVYFYDI